MIATPVEREATVTELLKLSGMFRQNAALKHGVPEASLTYLRGVKPVATIETPGIPSAPIPAAPIPIVPIPAPADPPTTDTPSSGSPPAPALGLSQWAKPLAVGAVVAAVGGVGLGLGHLLTRPTQPASDSTTIINREADRSGLLLPWLMEKGLHLPPEE